MRRTSKSAVQDELTIICPSLPDADQLSDQPTTGRLLAKLREKLREAQTESIAIESATEGNPPEIESFTEALKEFETVLDTLDETYKTGIPDIVKAYQNQYENTDSTSPWKLPLNQPRDMKDFSDLDWIDEDLRAEILAFWNQYFYKKVEPKKPKSELIRLQEAVQEAQALAQNILGCEEQAQKEAEKAELQFNELQDFQNQIDEYFTQLSSRAAEFKEYHDTGKHKKAFAVFIVYLDILDQIRGIGILEAALKREQGEDYQPIVSPKDADWLQNQLTAALETWALAAYEYFCRRRDALRKNAIAQSLENKFTKLETSHHDRFIREVEDIKVPVPAQASKSLVETF